MFRRTLITSRSTSEYGRLPPQFVTLSVLKLDGSCFEVEVSVMGTVGDLKRAVEDLFDYSQDYPFQEISWSHVWGNFCLSYKGKKLVDDKLRIRSLGIKDCDQLRFVNYKPTDGQAKARSGSAYWRRTVFRCV